MNYYLAVGVGVCCMITSAHAQPSLTAIVAELAQCGGVTTSTQPLRWDLQAQRLNTKQASAPFLTVANQLTQYKRTELLDPTGEVVDQWLYKPKTPQAASLTPTVKVKSLIVSKGNLTTMPTVEAQAVVELVGSKKDVSQWLKANVGSWASPDNPASGPIFQGLHRYSLLMMRTNRAPNVWRLACFVSEGAFE